MVLATERGHSRLAEDAFIAMLRSIPLDRRVGMGVASRLYQIGCALVIGVGILMLIMLGILAFLVVLSPSDSSFLPFLLFIALIALIIAAAVVDAVNRQKRVDRIRALGHRVIAHFVRVGTSLSSISDGVTIQTTTHYHLEAAWLDPHSEQQVILRSQSIPQAIALSFQLDDPVVVFVDPADPTACVFDLNTHV